MSEPKPTAAAMRIAARMFEGDGPVPVAMICELAGEIDGLAHLPEIREALKLGRDYAREALPDRSAIEDIQTIDAAIAALEKP